MKIFDAVWTQATRLGTPDKLAEAAALKLAARARKREIDVVRAERDQWRKLHRRADVNGSVMALDMHPLE